MVVNASSRLLSGFMARTAGRLVLPSRIATWKEMRAKWLQAATAAAVLGFGVVSLICVYGCHQAPTDPHEAMTVESLVEGSAPLVRHDFTLRWSAGPDDAFYDVLVADKNLKELAQIARLEEPQYRVPEVVFEDLKSGATILWKVDMYSESMGRFSSRTFVQQLQ